MHTQYLLQVVIATKLTKFRAHFRKLVK